MTTLYEAKLYFKKEIEKKIMDVVESHDVRLKPSEYKQLVDEYINAYIENIPADTIIQISEFIKRRTNANKYM